MAESLPAGYDNQVLAYHGFGAPDLSRRGLTPGDAPVAVLLLDIEAHLVIDAVWSEAAFPVAELARALALWLGLPDAERGDFAFESMAYDVPGAVRIWRGGEGWRVGSVFADGAWSSPVARAELAGFVGAVRADVAALGADPGFIPEVPPPPPR